LSDHSFIISTLGAASRNFRTTMGQTKTSANELPQTIMSACKKSLLPRRNSAVGLRIATVPAVS
jgi:hypothetical protein